MPAPPALAALSILAPTQKQGFWGGTAAHWSREDTTALTTELCFHGEMFNYNYRSHLARETKFLTGERCPEHGPPAVPARVGDSNFIPRDLAVVHIVEGD